MSPAPVYDLVVRDIIGDVQSAPQTFSSWNSCMTKAYCKWPAIIGIVIASLIVFSIVWCFARCLCCGASCCCECFRCCGCFESCTRPRGSNDSRYKDQYAPVQNQQPMPYQGYQAPPMMYGAGAPQFATFDASSKKIHEDSLPAMPSWDTAQTRRVEDHSQDMEMKDLEHQDAGAHGLGRNDAYAPVAHSAVSPIHSPYGHDDQAEYMHSAAGAQHPYASDLGAQRLNQNPYSDHDQHQQPYASGGVPLSPAPTYSTGPAPTYHTTQPQSQRPPVNHNQSYGSNRYISSPPPPSGAWSPVDDDNSTRYEPTEYHGGHSQYQQQDNNYYQNLPISPVRQQHIQAQRSPSFGPPAGQARPPSFLQVGRKPVNGSVREL